MQRPSLLLLLAIAAAAAAPSAAAPAARALLQAAAPSAEAPVPAPLAQYNLSEPQYTLLQDIYGVQDPAALERAVLADLDAANVTPGDGTSAGGVALNLFDYGGWAPGWVGNLAARPLPAPPPTAPACPALCPPPLQSCWPRCGRETCRS